MVNKYKFAYYLLSLIILSGFYFHISDNQQVFIYSYSYLLTLLAVSLLVLIVLPRLIIKIADRVGAKHIALSGASVALVITGLYLLSHYRYYAKERHAFDPYLQMPRQEFDSTDIKRPGDYLILCLGGSTTEEGYPAVLSEKLSKRYPDLSIRTFNAGRQWYTSKHSMLNYVSYYRNLRPDMIIVMHAINDLYRSFTPSEYAYGSFKYDYSHFYGPSIKGARPKTFERHFYETRGSFFRNYWFSMFFPKFKATDFPLSAYQSMGSFKDYLTTLIQYAKTDHVECVIVEQPSLYRENMSDDELCKVWFGKTFCHTDSTYASPESLRNAMAAYNEIAREIASNEGVLFINTGVLERSLENFYDDVHYTPKGTELLAQMIAEQIDSSGIIPKWRFPASTVRKMPDFP